MPSSSAVHHPARSGVIATLSAFFIWGLLPLYLKPLHAVAALQITAWRCLMGGVFAVGWLVWRGEFAKVRAALANPSVRWRLLGSATLLSVNWILYAWSVAHGQVLTASLGYFINPLVNVLLGVVVLSERLNWLQWLAVTLATAAVAWLTISSGELPWIALVLASTFSLYGLLRKIAAVEALPGLAAETLLVMPAALIYLVCSEALQGDVLHHSVLEQVLLIIAGPVTAIPLVLFAFGARRINYATVGMLQYIAPTLQFIVGVMIYRESLSSARLVCFSLIWLALAIYAGDSVWRSRALRALA